MESETLYSQLEEITIKQATEIEELVSKVGGFPIIVTEEPGYAFNVEEAKFVPFSTITERNYKKKFSIKNSSELGSNIDKMGSSVPVSLSDMYIQNVSTNPEEVIKLPLEEAISYLKEGKQFEEKINLMLDQQKETIVGFLNLLQFRRGNEQQELKDNICFELPFDIYTVLAQEPSLLGVPKIKRRKGNKNDPTNLALKLTQFMDKHKIELESTAINFDVLEDKVKEEVSNHIIDYLVAFAPENAFEQLKDRSTLAYKCRILDYINKFGSVENDYSEIIDGLNRSYLETISEQKNEIERVISESKDYKKERENNDREVNLEFESQKNLISDYQKLISESIEEDQKRPMASFRKKMLNGLVAGLIGFSVGYLTNDSYGNNEEQPVNSELVTSDSNQERTSEEIRDNLINYQRGLNPIVTDLINEQINPDTAIQMVNDLNSDYHFTTIEDVCESNEMKEKLYRTICENQ